MNNNTFRTYFKITFIFLITGLTFSGCELIGDIFKAGIWVGIIIVIIIAAVIMWIVRKFKR
jgi:hypothetical protein